MSTEEESMHSVETASNWRSSGSQPPHPEQAPVIREMRSKLALPSSISCFICAAVVPLQPHSTSVFRYNSLCFVVFIGICQSIGLKL